MKILSPQTLASCLFTCSKSHWFETRTGQRIRLFLSLLNHFSIHYEYELHNLARDGSLQKETVEITWPGQEYLYSITQNLLCFANFISGLGQALLRVVEGCAQKSRCKLSTFAALLLKTPISGSIIYQSVIFESGRQCQKSVCILRPTCTSFLVCHLLTRLQLSVLLVWSHFSLYAVLTKSFLNYAVQCDIFIVFLSSCLSSRSLPSGTHPFSWKSTCLPIVAKCNFTWFW